MSVYDPRVDAYIEKAAAFAQPILLHLRDLIHSQCPDVQETIKWGFPQFEYKKRILFSLAAFKQHCAFSFWLASLLSDPKGILQLTEKAAMGSLGRIGSLQDLPPETAIKRFIKESIKLADEGVKVQRDVKTGAEEIAVPGYLLEALNGNARAKATFEQFSPSHRKEYVEWISEAKREETRNKRIAEAMTWLAEGKPRHWKYHK